LLERKSSEEIVNKTKYSSMYRVGYSGFIDYKIKPLAYIVLESKT